MRNYWLTEAHFSLVRAYYWCNEDSQSITTLRPAEFYTHAKAACSDKGGLFTPLLDNVGHQAVLSMMRQNATQEFNVWTGLTRYNATHFIDKSTLMHADQIEHLQQHRSCSSNTCALVYTLYATIKDGGQVEWANDIPGVGVLRHVDHFHFTDKPSAPFVPKTKL